MNRGVLAIFVKTPELSPVKTRLAASIGKDAAIHFYNLSLRAIEAVAKELKNRLPDVDIVWAVAEPEALDMQRWQAFKTVHQGDGGLGERLSCIYDQLKEKYQYVCFIGADSPQILPDELVQAMLETKLCVDKKEFVIGDTDDGGFYFFGGSLNIDRDIWLGVEYSSEKTSSQLKEKLIKVGQIKNIPTLFDVDVVDDLRRLLDHSPELVEQKAVIDWARSAC